MRRSLVVITVSVGIMGGCGGSDSGSLTVLAAASLSDALPEITDAFEAHVSGVEVDLTFDGSSRLAAAIAEGAPGDVFASADEPSMDAVGPGRLGGVPVHFATNHLVIAVPAGNPRGIERLADLTEPDLVVALCAASVPCGSYAREAFDRAGVQVPAGGEEENVRAVLNRIALGEADAGIVYATDLRAQGVDGVELPSEVDITATYLVAPLADSGEDATAFVEFLLGPEAQAILERHGFGPP